MSAPEPLRLTLEEAIQRLLDMDYVLEVRGSYHHVAGGIQTRPNYNLKDQWGEDVGVASTPNWWDLASDALGVPVVERDDRAELIEAASEAQRLLSSFCGAPTMNGKYQPPTVGKALVLLNTALVKVRNS